MPLPAGSTPVTILSGPIFYDPVLSRVRLTVSPTYLNANPYFETNASNWTVQGGTFVRSTAQFHEGAASGLLTPDGVSGFAIARADPAPVTAGSVYRGSAWIRCDVARTVRITIDWLDSGAGVLSSTDADLAVAATTWTFHEVSGTAPVGAVQTRLVVWMQSSPPASHLLYIDEAMIEPSPLTIERSTNQIVWTTVRGGADMTSVAGEVKLDDYEFSPDVVNYYRLGTLWTGSITPVLDGVWLKSLARPFLNRAVTPRDFSPARRPSRGGVFEVKGRSDPIAVTDVRGSKRFTLDINTYSDLEASELDLLLATGDILLVHVPTTGRLRVVPGGYVMVGDSEELVLPTLDLVHRVFSVQLTRCAAPGPDIVGATITCAGVLNLYASCAALLAAHSTCADVLSLVGSPADVLVP